ncbi:MAG: hypothetical protein ACOH2V_11775 [Candidatus Saccharimonadaceae bacterium]
MKKVLIALAMLPLFAFVGCSNDDDNTPKVDFDHNIELLYGEWRATSVEGIGEVAIDLTNSEIEKLVTPTYVTFKSGGAYSTKGILGEGAGKYTTKDSTIVTALGKDKISFEMTSLAVNTAKIKLNPKDVDFGKLEIPAEIKTVTVVLTKQKEK